MSIRITTKEIVGRGIKKYQILKIEGAKALEDLPQKYLDNGAGTIINCGPNVLRYYRQKEAYWHWQIIVGCTIPKKEFEEKLELLRECGTRLSKINKQLMREGEKWNKERVFVI